MNIRPLFLRSNSCPDTKDFSSKPALAPRRSLPNILCLFTEESPFAALSDQDPFYFSSDMSIPDTPSSLYFSNFQDSNLLTSEPQLVTAPSSSSWSAAEFRPPFEEWDSEDDLESPLAHDYSDFATRYESVVDDISARLRAVPSGIPRGVTALAKVSSCAASSVSSPLPPQSTASLLSPHEQDAPMQLPALGRAPSFCTFDPAVARTRNFCNPLKAHPLPPFGPDEIALGFNDDISSSYTGFLQSCPRDASPKLAPSSGSSSMDSPTIPLKTQTVPRLGRNLTVKHHATHTSSISPDFKIGSGLSDANRKSRPSPIYAPALFNNYSIDFFSPEQAEIALSNYNLLSPDIPQTVLSSVFGPPPSSPPSVPLPALPVGNGVSTAPAATPRRPHRSAPPSLAHKPAVGSKTPKPSKAPKLEKLALKNVFSPSMAKFLDSLKPKLRPWELTKNEDMMLEAEHIVEHARNPSKEMEEYRDAWGFGDRSNIPTEYKIQFHAEDEQEEEDTWASMAQEIQFMVHSMYVTSPSEEKVNHESINILGVNDTGKCV